MGLCLHDRLHRLRNVHHWYDIRMRVLVTGSRDYDSKEDVYHVLDALHREQPITLLIHGAARGADTLCAEWAKDKGVKTDPYPILQADWDRFGNKAGPIRNTKMLNSMPDLCVAFNLGTSGTTDMMRKAHDFGIKVVDVLKKIVIHPVIHRADVDIFSLTERNTP
jgi:hypothetical protein